LFFQCTLCYAPAKTFQRASIELTNNVHDDDDLPNLNGDDWEENFIAKFGRLKR